MIPDEYTVCGSECCGETETVRGGERCWQAHFYNSVGVEMLKPA